MPNAELPIAVCAVVAEILNGSHPVLEQKFLAAGAPGPPPELPHSSKWKTWLKRASTDPKVDSLVVLGRLIEEFMDLPPAASAAVTDDPWGAVLSTVDPVAKWQKQRDRVNSVLNEYGLQYFRGGRVLPTGIQPSATTPSDRPGSTDGSKPTAIEELLETLIRGLPRAMHPLAHRRKGAVSLSFDIESDVQDLLHSQLRPWIADIRPEEFTPSYAGSSTRMDFLLPRHRLVLETKRVRDKPHARKVADELIIDIEHYRRHPECDRLWCVVYDPMRFIQNPAAFSDLEGNRSTPDGSVAVRMFVFH